MITENIPTDIVLLQKAKELRLTYADGTTRSVSVAMLRANSPSADNHSVKRNQPPRVPAEDEYIDVNIMRIAPVGHYALQFYFTDGHSTGIYSWALLYELSA